MSHLFLSHDHRDADLARIFATTLTRITLSQLHIWYSSDDSPGGGIEPGGVWLDKIREQLTQSKAVVALLSPRSIDRPWLLFETGFGAANEQCEIIPICIGISADTVPFPLAMYQCFQLSDYESLKRFSVKILAKYSIDFDEELMRPVLENAIADFTTTMANNTVSGTASQAEISLESLQCNLTEHIDRRFFEIAERQTWKSPNEKMEDFRISYTIPIHIIFPKFNSTQHLEINKSTKLNEVMDNIWYMLKGNVPPYSYLEKWILHERKKNLRLIVREVQHVITARDIFKPNSKWEVLPLDKPYIAMQSDHPD